MTAPTTRTDTHASDAAAIVLDGVTVRRGGRVALESVTLRLTEQRVAVVGRNGSGKSTLARLVKGLLSPDAGTVRVFGLNPARRERRAIADIGFLFQNSDHQILCPTVAEEIAFGPVELGAPRAEADRRARAILDLHGIAAWADRPVTALSEGQRRLVCLLAVLVSDPRLLVLDEPFAGLDIPTRLRLQAFIAELPQQVLLISHEPESLDGFDRALWLEEGRLAADGPPSEVLPVFTRAMHALVPDEALPGGQEGAAWVA